MAKEVIVLGIEGGFLHGVRLEEHNGTYKCTSAESWPITEDLPAALPAEAPDDAQQPENQDATATEAVLEEDKPLARAFKAAAEFFEQREFALTLPLSKLLVKSVRMPVEAREDLLAAATLALDDISPFPDEVLAPAAEVVAETDTEIQVVVAALPAAAALEISAALDAAKVHVTHTDATALGWLRSLWPRICEVEASRRLVLLDFGDGWELAVIDEGAPVQLRGIGKVDSVAALGREVTLSMLSGGGGAQDVQDVVVCCMQPPDEDVVKRLSMFGPVRTVSVDNASSGVEGCARRIIEGGTFDVTPADWVETRTESRFRTKMKLFLGAAVGLWLLIMGVLFGYEMVYDHMKDNQNKISKKHAKAYQEVVALTNRVALLDRYQDRSKCALEIFKILSDNLPEGDDTTLSYFSFKRGEGVNIKGKTPDREYVRKFEDKLRLIPDPSSDQEGSESFNGLFKAVVPKGKNNRDRDGMYGLDFEVKFQSDEKDGEGSSE